MYAIQMHMHIQYKHLLFIYMVLYTKSKKLKQTELWGLGYGHIYSLQSLVHCMDSQHSYLLFLQTLGTF